MSMPRPDQESKAFFGSIVPDDARIQIRPMFGQLAAFLNGNMFMGLFGNDVFVRLPDADRTELLGEQGASIFEPMGGRPMKEYVVFPSEWRARPERIHPWITRSLEWVGQMGEKKPK